MKNRVLKIILISIFSVAVIFTVSFYWSVNNGSSNYSGVSIENMSLSEDIFSADAVMFSSGTSFRKYEYEIDGSSLYITIYTGLVTKKYSSGNMRIEITDPQLNQVDFVYLKDGEQTKMIYEAPIY